MVSKVLVCTLCIRPRTSHFQSLSTCPLPEGHTHLRLGPGGSAVQQVLTWGGFICIWGICPQFYASFFTVGLTWIFHPFGTVIMTIIIWFTLHHHVVESITGDNGINSNLKGKIKGENHTKYPKTHFHRVGFCTKSHVQLYNIMEIYTLQLFGQRTLNSNGIV